VSFSVDHIVATHNNHLKILDAVPRTELFTTLICVESSTKNASVKASFYLSRCTHVAEVDACVERNY